MPDRPDRSRLLILWPHGMPPEGLTSVPTDLKGFVRLAERIGATRALLLLTIRALRQRAVFAGVRLHDLSWMLGLSRLRLLVEIERLSKAGLVVYQHADGEDAITVEFTGGVVEPSVLSPEAEEPVVKHDVPTHWFVQVLPRIGRAEFAVYLLLRSREADGHGSLLPIARLARGVGLRNAHQARRLLRRLARFGLVRSRGGGSLVVLDPPPLTPAGRLFLRLVEMGALPRTRVGRRSLAFGAAGLLLALAWLLVWIALSSPTL